ncbi:MAG: nitrate/nitrite transport system permease protein [Betaproteobacteria bacterium]|jgi:nitrate/nitrite transport system permease protein|nr:nitrate/nitrite transport system permease protein [Betaproteobacteria bacterium]
MRAVIKTLPLIDTVAHSSTRPPAAVIPHPSAPALAAAADRAAAASESIDRTARRQRTELAARIVAPLLGVLAFLAIWSLVSMGGSIPGPAKTWNAAVQVFSDPFYKNGPNDQGIAWKIGGSLGRVGVGFGFAALVGIPLGFLIGRFAFLRNMAEPVIGLLRPVSPLAWLPIGLLVFKGANPAAIWTIFISSIWPMIINTAVGVQRVPSDYLNVARVLNLSEWKVFTKILFPAVLPYMLTGVRLSMGVAWLVIVAAEMLTGGVGLGFWVWDEWNNLKVENILIAIIVIGIIGLALEQLLLLIAKRWQYD